MLLQVCRDYHGIGNGLLLRMHQVRFLYRGLREELKTHTKPQPTPRRK